jgi:hypothetical protein
MGRAGILYEEVAEAAERMLLAGVSPTLEKLRSQLGAGSYSTLSKHLQSWRMMKKQAPEPAAPPDPVGAAVGQVWHEIRMAAEAEIDKIKNESQQRVLFAEQKLVDTERHAQEQLSSMMLELQKTQGLYEVELESAKELSELLKSLQEKHALAQTHLEKADVREKSLLEERKVFLKNAEQERAFLKQEIADQWKNFKEQHHVWQKKWDDHAQTHEKHAQHVEKSLHTCLQQHTFLLDAVKKNAEQMHAQEQFLHVLHQKTLKESMQWKEQLAACAREREMLAESLEEERKKTAAYQKNMQHTVEQMKKQEEIHQKQMADMQKMWVSAVSDMRSFMEKHETQKPQKKPV